MSRRVSGITIPVKYMTNTKGLKEAQSAFGKFGVAVAAIAAAAVAAVATIGTAAVRMASEFEDNFAKIQGLVGVAESDLGVLKNAAIELGPAYGKSVNEAAEALFFITSAGLRGADAVEVLEASLKGAAVGLGDTKTIADLATSAVNAYGSEVLGGAEAVDVLTEAVREGKLEPQELAGSMGQVLPIASNLGVSFQEVGAAFAAMSRTGTDASQASTQLRGILNALVKPTSQAEKTLADMGLSAEGLREQIREQGLLATLETLTDAFDGNIEATASVFGNVRALTGVLDLMGSNVEDTRQIFANMTDDVGALDDAFAITEQTASFKFAKAMETAKASLLPVGDMLLEIGGRLLDSLMPTIERFAPMLEEMFAHLEEPLNALVDVFPALLDAMLPLMPLLGQIAGIVADLVVAALPIFTALLDSLVPIFQKILPPLADLISQLAAGLTPIFLALIEVLDPIIDALLPPLMILFDALAPVVIALVEALLPLIELLLPMFVKNVELVTPVLEFLAQVIGEVLTSQLDRFTGALSSAFGFFQDIWSKITSLFSTSLESLIQWFRNIPNQVLRVLGGAIGWLVGIGRNIIQGLRNGIETIWSNLSAWFRDIPNMIRNMLSGAASWLTNIGRQVIDGFLNGLTGAWKAVTDWISGAAEGVSGAFKRILGISSPSKVFMEHGMDIGRGLALGLEKIEPAVAQNVTSLVDVNSMTRHASSSPSRIAGDAAGGITIVVNAGMGTDGAEVGRKVVDAIRQYERRSGKVFAAA